VSRADALVAAAGARWSSLVEHPFVLATADGTLSAAAFDRWLLDDHAFVLQFRDTLAEVVGMAPDPVARQVLAGGLAALGPELALFADELAARGLDPSAHQPSGACQEYLRWLRSSPEQGWDVALAVLHGVERAYLDAWTAVRERSTGHRYAAFVHNWSSREFAAWVDALVGLLGEEPPTAEQVVVHREVAELEHAFWDAVHTG
jgi:thiaminase